MNIHPQPSVYCTCMVTTPTTTMMATVTTTHHNGGDQDQGCQWKQQDHHHSTTQESNGIHAREVHYCCLFFIPSPPYPHSALRLAWHDLEHLECGVCGHSPSLLLTHCSCLPRLWMGSLMSSVWKSSYKTGKRPRLDWTLTDQDQKFIGLIKTITAVWSSIHQHFGKSKTKQRPVLAVSTSLHPLKLKVTLWLVQFHFSQD
jgi:hypothetical protein